MFVDKYAIYTLSLVIFVYFNAFHIKPLLWQRTDDVKVIKNRVLVNYFMSGKMTVKFFHSWCDVILRHLKDWRHSFNDCSARILYLQWLVICFNHSIWRQWRRFDNVHWLSIVYVHAWLQSTRWTSWMRENHVNGVLYIMELPVSTPIRNQKAFVNISLLFLAEKMYLIDWSVFNLL